MKKQPPQQARNYQDTSLANKNLHFLGIGGSGMSGLARLAAAQGANVSGADMRPSPAVLALQKEGFAVDIDNDTVRLPADTDCLVISAAIPKSHRQVVDAEKKGIKILKYAQLLGELMLNKKGVAIAGTHGKSSATSMLSYCLIEAGLDPSFIVGARCEQIGGGSRCSAGDILVAEACEFDRSFHHLHPTLATILNVEADHLDIYGSLEEIVESFAQFAGKLPGADKGGFLLINHESPARLAITAGLKCAVETVGFASEADWQVEVKPDQVNLRQKGAIAASWKNPLPGDHMAYNAAVAVILAYKLGAEWKKIIGAIENFKGLDRRMQYVGTISVRRARRPPHQRGLSNTIVIDDYAHHPTEIEATLRAIKNHYQPQKLICIFQPHQHSRTRFLMQQFAVSFSQADLVIVPDIYFVRDSENERQEITAQDLVRAIQEQGAKALYVKTFDEIESKVRKTAQSGDLVITMGAGDIWKVSKALCG